MKRPIRNMKIHSKLLVSGYKQNVPEKSKSRFQKWCVDCLTDTNHMATVTEQIQYILDVTLDYCSAKNRRYIPNQHTCHKKVMAAQVLVAYELHWHLHLAWLALPWVLCDKCAAWVTFFMVLAQCKKPVSATEIVGEVYLSSRMTYRHLIGT